MIHEEENRCSECYQKIEETKQSYHHPRTSRLLCHDCAQLVQFKETWQPMSRYSSVGRVYVVKDKKAVPLRYLFPREPISAQEETPQKEQLNGRSHFVLLMP